MIIHFDAITIDTGTYSLLNDGKHKAVEPQVFNLIMYLIKHRDTVVSRQALFEDLWAGREVTDASLSNSIKLARTALGDDGQTQKTIKTVHGRGYQFVAVVTLDTHDEAESEAWASDATVPNVNGNLANTSLKTKKITLFFAVASVLILAVTLISLNRFSETNNAEAIAGSGNKSIAILPFENRSDLAEDIFFTDGIHDDLLTQISKIRDIKTISRTSVMSYRNTDKKIGAIAKELGVTTILEGGVQRAGSQVRINVQLIDAETDMHLWSETYTRELSVKNIFSIQSEISRSVASELKTILTPQEQNELERIPTQNIAALEAYFQAKSSSRKNTSKGYLEAVGYLEQAIKLDVNFSIAYAELGYLQLALIYWAGYTIEKQVAKAEPLISKAISLDSTSSEAYAALGKLNQYQYKYTAAEEAFKKAIELNPNNAKAYSAYGHFLLADSTRIPEAVKLLFKARSLNPKDDALGEGLANALRMAGRFNEAKVIVEDILLRKPDYAAAYKTQAYIAFSVNYDLAEGTRSGYKFIRLDPDVPSNSSLMAWGFIHIGHKELAIKWLRNSINLAPESSDNPVTQALIYEQQNDQEKLFEISLEISKTWSLYLYYLMKAGLVLDRTEEVFKHIQTYHPEFFKENVVVDANNFPAALALGRLLKERGEHAQANRLFQGSLIASRVENHGGWTGKHANWETRIHLAMGNNKAALAYYVALVESGVHSARLLADPDYKPLYNEPEYQRIEVIMKEKLKIENEKIIRMKANGELGFPFL